MTDPQQLQSQVLGYLKQGQDATLRLVHTKSEAWAEGGGVGGHGNVSPGPRRSSTGCST